MHLHAPGEGVLVWIHDRTLNDLIDVANGKDDFGDAFWRDADARQVGIGIGVERKELAQGSGGVIGIGRCQFLLDIGRRDIKLGSLLEDGDHGIDQIQELGLVFIVRTAARPASLPGRDAVRAGQAMAAPLGRRPPLIAIGASTGGPKTLAQVLGQIPAGLSTAFVVVQHIDAQFAPGLVSWLNGQIPMPVIPAEPGKAPLPGTVCLSVTNDHLVVEANGRFAHVAEPIEEPYRPSVNVFFQSLVRHWRAPGQAVLLTGMGRDG